MKKLTRNPFVRRIGIPMYRMYARRCVFLPEPRVLALSMPKAGTHLLGKLLSSLPSMMFSGLHLDDTILYPSGDYHQNSELDHDLLVRTLGRCLPGQYMTAHFPAKPELQKAIHDVKLKPILMLRDPRDVVVSYAHYVSREPRHFHCRYFNEKLVTVENKIMAAIRGLPETSETRGLLPIGQRIQDYLPWLDDPQVTACYFERLVGSGGGGSDEEQRTEVRKISEAVQRPLDDGQLQKISQRVFTQKSRTFRKGQIGDWANSFTEEHRLAFKEVAGEQLIRLGYESDLNW